VYSDEALAMGLANRVVADGTSRQEAEKLAHEIAGFPQACMRNDRLSAHEQFSMDLSHAFANEFAHGVASLNSPEFFEGLKRYGQGKGRKGSFTD
jgi:enoyl-CoA hydratase